MIQPETIREIHRICQEWESRPPFVAPRPRRMRWLPTWAALLVAAGVLFAGGWAPSIPLPGWWKIGFILAVLVFEIVCLIYLLVSMVVDAIPIWGEVKNSLNPFPPTEALELEGQLATLVRLAQFSEADLRFVAHSLETKSKRMENHRVALMGALSVVAAIVLFVVSHREGLLQDWSGLAVLQKVWGSVRLVAQLLGIGAGIGVVLGLGSAWLESSASANRALLLRRVVDDRASLTADGG
jgi:hypothetical protein